MGERREMCIRDRCDPMLTQRIEAIRQNYVNTKPQISCERAKIWTDSHRETEGQPVAIRRARAFYDCCDPVSYTHLDVYKRQERCPGGSFQDGGLVKTQHQVHVLDRRAGGPLA